MTRLEIAYIIGGILWIGMIGFLAWPYVQRRRRLRAIKRRAKARRGGWPPSGHTRIGIDDR